LLRLFGVNQINGFLQSINNQQLLSMVNIVIRKNFFSEPMKLSPIFQKFSEFGIKFILDEFHQI